MYKTPTTHTISVICTVYFQSWALDWNNNSTMDLSSNCLDKFRQILIPSVHITFPSIVIIHIVGIQSRFPVFLVMLAFLQIRDLLKSESRSFLYWSISSCFLAVFHIHWIISWEERRSPKWV